MITTLSADDAGRIQLVWSNDMHELTEAIQTATVTGRDGQGDPAALRRASIHWAEFALSTHDDVLLRKSLAISAAVADFCNEIERP